MKYLSDYTEAAQTALFKKTGAFFAFSKKQFAEGKTRKEGTTYASLGYGLYCPEENTEELISALDNIQKLGIQDDIKENGKEKIILRELSNYECFYTGDITEAAENLEQYGYTFEDVNEAYRAECNKQNEQEEAQA